jgi:hypothetical protein
LIETLVSVLILGRIEGVPNLWYTYRNEMEPSECETIFAAGI